MDTLLDLLLRRVVHLPLDGQAEGARDDALEDDQIDQKDDGDDAKDAGSVPGQPVENVLADALVLGRIL